jgi:hypothetical protein
MFCIEWGGKTAFLFFGDEHLIFAQNPCDAFLSSLSCCSELLKADLSRKAAKFKGKERQM